MTPLDSRARTLKTNYTVNFNYRYNYTGVVCLEFS